MFARILSAVLLFPILFYLVFAGGIYLKLGTIFVSLVAMYEFYKAVCKKIMPIHYFGFAIAISYLLLLDSKYSVILDIIFVIFFLVALIFMVINHKKINIYDVAFMIFGVCYIPLMFSTIYLIRRFEYGEITVWIPFISAWACDTGAYFTGIAIGKHKLTPELSPKKTIEGAIGGAVFSIVFCIIYGLLLYRYNFQEGHLFNNRMITIVIFAAIGLVGTIFSQFGDLTASAIKRRFNIKDYGKLIPGHGGILDRFDSIIFTAGASYLILKLVELYSINI